MLTEPKSLRKSAFAKAVGITPGRVSQMIAAGLPVDPDGRIDVARGKMWIKENINPVRSAAQSDQADLPFAAQPDAAAEKARLIREQADNVALKNAAMRRELVPAAEVKSTWTGIVNRARAKFLAAPARLRQRLTHLTASDIETIDTELRQILEELAHGK